MNNSVKKIFSLAEKFERKLQKKADIMGPVHFGLDILGLIPGIGEVFDATNALLYALQGDWLLCTLSIISMIPQIGDAVGKGSKAGIWLLDNAPKISTYSSKYGPKVSKTLKFTIKNGRAIFVQNKPKIDSFLSEIESGKRLPELKIYVPKIRQHVDEVSNMFAKSESLADSLID